MKLYQTFYVDDDIDEMSIDDDNEREAGAGEPDALDLYTMRT